MIVATRPTDVLGGREAIDGRLDQKQKRTFIAQKRNQQLEGAARPNGVKEFVDRLHLRRRLDLGDAGLRIEEFAQLQKLRKARLLKRFWVYAGE